MITLDGSALNKSEFQDIVRDHRGDIEELQDVALSQNKGPLVEDIESALSSYLNRLGSLPESGVMTDVPSEAFVFETSSSDLEDEAEDADTEDTDGADETAEDDEDDDPSYGEGLRPLSSVQP
jgi:hypothetical protein